MAGLGYMSQGTKQDVSWLSRWDAAGEDRPLVEVADWFPCCRTSSKIRHTRAPRSVEIRLTRSSSAGWQMTFHGGGEGCLRGDWSAHPS